VILYDDIIFNKVHIFIFLSFLISLLTK